MSVKNTVSDASTQEQSENLGDMNYTQVTLMILMGNWENQLNQLSNLTNMRKCPHKNIGTTFQLKSLTHPNNTAYCDYICANYWDTTHYPAFQLADYITLNISNLI